MATTNTQMIVRIDTELKQQVDRCAKNEGKTTSEVVRELLQQYTKERDVKTYLDDLWSRAGNVVKRQKLNADDVPNIIADVRKRNAQSRR